MGWSVHSWDVLMLPTLSFPVPLHGRCSWNVLELKSIRVLQLLLQNISQKQPKLGINSLWLCVQKIIIQRSTFHDALSSLHGYIEFEVLAENI